MSKYRIKKILSIFREQNLKRQMSLSMAQLRDLRTSNETNQARLLDQSQRQSKRIMSQSNSKMLIVSKDQDTVAKLAELDLIVADLERANARANNAERRNVRTFSIKQRKHAHTPVPFIVL